MTTKERTNAIRSVIMDMSAWDSLGAGSFDQERGAFAKLVDERVPTDRSTARHLTETGVIERNKSKLHEG